MLNKLLIICGPTATGKTNVAAGFAKKFGGELVSADSRQVYKYMDIGTGKDRPEGVKIWGYDLVRPDEEFSVSQYADFANSAINDIYSRNKLPILVGGTGLYIKAIVDSLGRIHIPRNLKLREELSEKSTRELYAMLLNASPAEALRLNASDRNNPRRLVRLLEITSSGRSPTDAAPPIKFHSVLWVGLRADNEFLAKRVKRRVDDRIKNGFAKEVQLLKQKDFYEHAPARTLGYKDWPDTEKWKTEEIKYAKRQLTWFNREARVNWFDIQSSNFEREIEKLVKKWYSSR